MTLDQMKHFAIRKHELKKKRYGNAPYSLHLEMVASLANKFIRYIEPKSRLNVLAACWAHDLLEDTDATFKELVEISNHQIANIVYCVSNEQAKTREERNFKTFSKIGANPLAVFVKCCDRLVNGSFSQINKPELFKKYQADYSVFKFALCQSGPCPKLWNTIDSLFYHFHGYSPLLKRPVLTLAQPENVLITEIKKDFKITISSRAEAFYGRF